MRLATLFGTATIILILACKTTAMAAPSSLDTDIPPPSPVFEVEPGERPGYIRTPGYWNWSHGRYVWIPGRWVAEQKGSLWTPDSWEQHGSKWHFVPGHWEADPEAANASEPVMISTNDEDIAELESATPIPDPTAKSPANGKKKPRIVRKKKIDYTDTKKWPRYIRR